MAPHEPLDDTETMRIKRMGGNANTDRWHGGPARETLLACLSAARGFIYFSVSKFYNLDYRSMKKGDSTEMKVTAACARCPVASVVSGVIGVSGGGVEGRIRVFRAQCTPVPYSDSRI